MKTPPVKSSSAAPNNKNENSLDGNAESATNGDKSEKIPTLPPVAKVQEKLPEWHIGLGGEIEGPYRQSELSAFFKKKKIDANSFVWREGMLAWRPMKAVEELERLLQESLHPVSPPSAPHQMQKVQGVSGLTPDAPDILIHDPEAERHFFQETDALDSGSPRESVMSENSLISNEQLDFSSPPLHKRAPRFVILSLVLALFFFGLAVGHFVWGGETVRIVEKVVEVERVVDMTAESTPLVASEREKVEELNDVQVELKERKNAPLKRKPGKPQADLKASQERPLKAEPIPGLEGLSSLSGPSAGPKKTSAQASGGPGLTSAQVQNTVAKHRAAVNRRCWQPALEARAVDAASTARVTVSMTVDHEGKVVSARSSGPAKGYPGLDSCITAKSKYWRFPRSGQRQTVKIPFIFAAQ